MHCAQWGTLPRLLTVLAGGGRGLALDEDTAVHLDGDGARVAGRGTAWLVDGGGATVGVTATRAGHRLP